MVRRWEEKTDHSGVGIKGFFWSDGNLRILVMVTRPYKFVKIHRTVYFKGVNFIMPVNPSTILEEGGRERGRTIE